MGFLDSVEKVQNIASINVLHADTTAHSNANLLNFFLLHCRTEKNFTRTNDSNFEN